MSKFIEVTPVDNEPRLINTDYILSVYKDGEYCNIEYSFGVDGRTIVILESYEQIARDLGLIRNNFRGTSC